MSDNDFLQIGQTQKCRKCDKTFSIDENFLCPYCLDALPTTLFHTFIYTKPIIESLLKTIEKIIKGIRKISIGFDILIQFYDRVHVLLIQLSFNQLLKCVSFENQDGKELRSFYKKIYNIPVPSTDKQMANLIQNTKIYETTSFYGECVFAIDTFFHRINKIININPDDRTAKILKTILKKTNNSLLDENNPIKAILEIRHTFHNNGVPNKSKCFKIKNYSFKLENGKQHHYTTLFHILFLLEQSIVLFETLVINLVELAIKDARNSKPKKISNR